MKISARNIFQGNVSAVKKGVVNSEVELSLSGNNKIVAIITNESLESLGLKEGAAAYAVIKAPLVLLSKGEPDLRFSTRNNIQGTVKKVEHGTVNAEVSIEVPGGIVLTSIVTEGSVKIMELKEGDRVTALFKASSVILAVRG